MRKKIMLQERVKAILILAGAAVILTLPILVRGPVFLGHDTREHLSFCQHFAEQFWQGDLYPRWLLNMNYGLGSASYFVYPPFPAYVYALLLPVAKILHLDAFSLGEYLCLLISGLCAFLWMTTIAGRRVALTAAAIYMLLPYHLTIDFYRRDALSECWALAWTPLVLYFTTQVVKNKRYATVGLSLAYGLLILSHLISVLMLSALPILLALTLAQRGRKLRSCLAVAGCFALGSAVSGAYLVPALANARYFPVSRLQIPIDSSPNGNLLTYGLGLLTSHSGKSGFIQAVSLATLDTTLFIAFCGFMALSASRTQRGQVWLWLAICPIPLLLMSGLSLPLWKAFPALANAVQFPWRLDVVLCVATLPLTAYLLNGVIGLPVRSRLTALVIVILFAMTWFAAYIQVVKTLPQDQNAAGTRFSIHDGWFAAWTPPGMNQESALQASTWPEAKFIAGNGITTVQVWKPRHIEVLADCTACGLLIIRQFYYPKWQADLVPTGERLTIAPLLPQGMLAVRVPPGRHQILVEMPRTFDEQIGIWLSFIGILICALLAALGSARNLTVSS